MQADKEVVLTAVGQAWIGTLCVASLPRPRGLKQGLRWCACKYVGMHYAFICSRGFGLCRVKGMGCTADASRLLETLNEQSEGLASLASCLSSITRGPRGGKGSTDANNYDH